MEYEYRAKKCYTSWDGCTFPWTPLGKDHTFSVELDYQFRVKPEFVPGYFRYLGDKYSDVVPIVSAHWHTENPGPAYERVDVTPVSDTAKAEPVELSTQDLNALPNGSKVLDRDGDKWEKDYGTWTYLSGDSYSSYELIDCYGPITLAS